MKEFDFSKVAGPHKLFSIMFNRIVEYYFEEQLSMAASEELQISIGTTLLLNDAPLLKKALQLVKTYP